MSRRCRDCAAALQQEPLAEVVQTALRVYAERVSNGQEYIADFVAVLQGRVIDHDANRVALLQRVRAMVGDEPVLITPADAEAPREFRYIGLRATAGNGGSTVEMSTILDTGADI